MRDNFLVFGTPLIEQEEIEEVVATLKSGWLGTGPKVELFTSDFAQYKDVPYAAAVNSCTAALHLSMLAAGIKPGDEVITTPLTFCATVNAICHAGATPVLADIEKDTMNIDPEKIKDKITKKTKAILPVHFAGRPCNMDAIMQITSKNNLILIEDCAHAIETEYKGQQAGTFGEFGCFSFYVTKNVITGEGGMVISRNEDYISQIKVLALHGMSRDAWKRYSDDGFKHYYLVNMGFKYNMTDLSASLGIHQLNRVEKYWKRREEIWNIYNRELAGLPITLPANSEPGTRHAYHLYTILVDENNTGIKRDDFVNEMKKKNIGTGVHYISIAEHPYYQDVFGWVPDDFPISSCIGRQTVSLPLSPKLSDTDVNDVIKAVKALIIP